MGQRKSGGFVLIAVIPGLVGPIQEEVMLNLVALPARRKSSAVCLGQELRSCSKGLGFTKRTTAVRATRRLQRQTPNQILAIKVKQRARKILLAGMIKNRTKDAWYERGELAWHIPSQQIGLIRIVVPFS